MDENQPIKPAEKTVGDPQRAGETNPPVGATDTHATEPVTTQTNRTAADGGGGGNGARRAVETVSPDGAGETGGKVEVLKPDQRAAFTLAVGAGALIIVVTLGIGIKFFENAPWIGIPNGLDNMSPEQAKTVIDNVKAMNDIAIDRVVKLFNAVVGQSLLPVFTSILGYIFGSRVANSQKNG